jgi:hypothetical protein
VVVGVSIKGGDISGLTVTATYGGTSMTELGRKGSNNSTNGGAIMFGLASPASGAQTVVVTCASHNLIGGSITFTGSTAIGTAVTAFGDNSSGTQPPRVSNASGPAAPWTGTTVVANSGTSVTLDFTGATVGEWMFAAICLGDAQTSLPSAPSGWTLVAQGSESASGAASSCTSVFKRRKVAGDTTQVFTWAVSCTNASAPFSYPNLDATTPVEGATYKAHTSGTTYPTNAITPTQVNRWIASVFHNRTSTSTGTWTPDAAMTERLDFASAANAWNLVELADTNGTVTAASHTYTATASVTSSHGASVAFALVPKSTIPSSANDMVVDVIAYGSGVSNPIGTQRWLDNVDTATAAGNAAQSTYPGATEVTVGYDPTLHDWWGMVAVNVQASSGGTTVNGTGSADLGAISASGTGVAIVLGAGTAPLDTFSASGTGVAVVLGAGTAPLGALVATGGTFTIFGSGSAGLGGINASGAGTVIVPGSGTAPLGSISASGAGSGVPTVAGSGTASLGALGASGLGVVTVLGGGTAALGTINALLDQILLFSPTQRRQVTMMEGSLRYSYMVSFTTWKDQAGVWHSAETPPHDALLAASHRLSISGRPQIVDDQTANELRAAGVGTVEAIARVNASQWI